MASKMHFFTILVALAVLFALSSAAQLEDSPVSEGAVVPEVTEIFTMTSASSGSTPTETHVRNEGSGSGSIPITAPTNVLACGKEWPTAEFKDEWNGYCSGTAAPCSTSSCDKRDAGFSSKRPFEGSQSFALDSTCSVGSPWYSTKGRGVVESNNVVIEARSQCMQKHGQMCKTFDIDRNKCFGCFAGGGNFEPPTGVKNSWEEYCKTPGKTTFAMSGACGQTAWASGENANEDALVKCNAAGSEQCFPFDFNGEKCPVGPDAAHDLRPHMPSCLQVEPNWCWATGVTEVTRFFGDSAADTRMLNKDRYISQQKGKGVDTHFLDASAYTNKHCGGIECLVVGTFGKPVFTGAHKSAPYACCEDRKKCMNAGGDAEMEAAAINYNMKNIKSSQRYAGYYPVSRSTTESILNKIFAARKPVIMNVGWICGGVDYNPTTDYPMKATDKRLCSAHATTLAGMDGMGRYYLHDPMNRDNNYQALTMSELLTYRAPEYNYDGTPVSFAIPSEFLPRNPDTHCHATGPKKFFPPCCALPKTPRCWI